MESISSLLSNLTSALDSATSVLPTEESIQPPAEGISLLNVKNELLLSYVQHLTFLLLLKLRNNSVYPSNASNKAQPDGSSDKSSVQQEDVVKKLVEFRVYLEKGVRPLEGKLKYQIDKVVKAAEDADRAAQQKPTKKSGTAKANKGKGDGESSEEEDGSDESSQAGSEIDELSYRPNPAAFRRAPVPESAKDATSTNDGIYRPPRIAPTVLPEARREEKASRRPAKSATIDEFIATELSAAPMAEPSIGSTIAAGGRHMKSRKEQEKEAERREYEESNLVRLPKLSKKERAKANGGRRDNFGGEDWRDLTAGVDRIDKLTKKKAGVGGALQRSRKRAVEDGPRGSGAEFSQGFEKRRRRG